MAVLYHGHVGDYFKWPIDPGIRAVDSVIRLNLVTSMISSLTFVPVHFATQVIYDGDQPSDSQFISNVHNFDVFCSSTVTPPKKAQERQSKKENLIWYST